MHYISDAFIYFSSCGYIEPGRSRVVPGGNRCSQWGVLPSCVNSKISDLLTTAREIVCSNATNDADKIKKVLVVAKSIEEIGAIDSDTKVQRIAKTAKWCMTAKMEMGPITTTTPRDLVDSMTLIYYLEYEALGIISTQVISRVCELVQQIDDELLTNLMLKLEKKGQHFCIARIFQSIDQPKFEKIFQLIDVEVFAELITKLSERGLEFPLERFSESADQPKAERIVQILERMELASR